MVGRTVVPGPHRSHHTAEARAVSLDGVLDGTQKHGVSEWHRKKPHGLTGGWATEPGNFNHTLWRRSLANGEAKYDNQEQRVQASPNITVPAIDACRAAFTRRGSPRCQVRLITIAAAFLVQPSLALRCRSRISCSRRRRTQEST